MSLWFSGRPVSRFADEVFREFDRLDRGINPYWRDADHSILHVANTTQEVVNNENKFAVSLDVSQFKPEELQVHVDGRELTIEGKQEVKDSHGFMQRSFLRKWTLPTDADLDAITPSISDKGHLTIEVLKKANENTRRTIPIQPEVTAP
uniref:SHSP domain-containing protein n=1 Tax=Heterorhabditis bacteriophora TaxID=37862 RepID=A0A1I7XQ80_HETBA